MNRGRVADLPRQTLALPRSQVDLMVRGAGWLSSLAPEMRRTCIWSQSIRSYVGFLPSCVPPATDDLLAHRAVLARLPGPARSALGGRPAAGVRQGEAVLQVLSDGALHGGGRGAVVGDHARRFPPAGKHGLRGGSAARRQFGGEANAP